MVLDLPFNDYAGGQVTDYSVNRSNAGFTGYPTNIGWNNGYVEKTDSPSYYLTAEVPDEDPAEFSIEAIVAWLATPGAYEVVAGHGDNSSIHRFWFGTRNSTQLRSQIGCPEGDCTYDYNFTYTLNKWEHFIVTAKAGANSYTYANGSLIGSGSLSGKTLDNISSTTLHLLHNVMWASNLSPRRIMLFRYWFRELSEPEIITLFRDPFFFYKKFKAFSGGGLVAASITESAATAESSSATATFQAAVNESAATSESASAAATKPASITESSAAADSCSASVIKAASAIESAAAGESSSATVAGGVSITESAVASESSSAIVIRAASATESAVAAEQSSATATFSAFITESASASEESSTDGTITATVLESCGAVDSPSATVQFSASVQEECAVSEASSATKIIQASITESCAASDSSDAVVGNFADINESASLTESSSATVIFQATLSESISASESCAATLIANASIVESASISDQHDAEDGTISVEIIEADSNIYQTIDTSSKITMVLEENSIING